MSEVYVFQPERQRGLIVNSLAATGFSVLGASGLLQAAHANIGLVFLLFLLPALFMICVVPLLAYRIFSLQVAYYRLEREGIRLRWGLRQEDVPMDCIKWVSRADDLDFHLPLPFLRWPGAVLGKRSLPGKAEVEFLAASQTGLILIATIDRVYAISPANSNAFLEAYERLTELGSLTPLPARSSYPTVLLSRVWATKPARILLITGFGLSLILLIWVVLIIPSRAQITLNVGVAGRPAYIVPSIRLLLLPLLNSFIFIFDLGLGIFFFRHAESQSAGLPSGQILAYLLWGSGATIPFLFLIATFQILSLK